MQSGNHKKEKKDEEVGALNQIDNPFPPETLPEEVLKKLEQSGLLTSSPPRPRAPSPATGISPAQMPPSMPPKLPPIPSGSSQPKVQIPAQSPISNPPLQPSAQPQSVTGKKTPPSPPPPKPKGEVEAIKSKLQPLIPNLQKLLKLLAGTVLPMGASSENVRVGPEGSIMLGQLEIGRTFEGVDGDKTSIRLFFTNIGIKDKIPDSIRARFPVSETLLTLHKSGEKFFIITEKTISLGFGKSQDSPPSIFIPGNL